MASAITGNTGPRPTGRRQSSLSSFPNTGVRPPSRNGRSASRPGGRSPNPSTAREHSQSASVSSASTNTTTGVRRAGDTTNAAAAPAQPPVTTINTSEALRPAAPTDTMGASTARKLRPQYPTNGYENHVEYILVASFDIDRGSVMEHQYPAPISGDETMLAELMLPDQAHVRSQDWTIFFLHKDVEAEEEARDERRRKRRERQERRLAANESGEQPDGQDDSEDVESTGSEDDESTTQGEDDVVEGPPLIYVLNLVNTKQDNSVKRGAIVKAMAICTRHSFLHIYKPILLLALEDYFRNPQIETLASLYDAVNSMDLSLMPHLNSLERSILQASEAKDLFIEKFSTMIQQRKAADAASIQEEDAAGSPVQPPQYTLPRDTHEFESAVYYNKIRVPIKVPTAVATEQVGDFSLIKLISTFAGPHASSAQPFALHPHLTTSGAYTHPIIVLINAVLTQKRIIFLGHNRPSGEVAEAVLAACALASGGILRGFTRHAFPYTDLTKIDDLLKVPGFIAGVTNPAFAHKPEWWDLLCDLPTGRMKISNRIEGAPVTEGLMYFQQQSLQLPPALAGGGPNGVPALAGTSISSKDANSTAADATGDYAFMESLLGSIASRHGEAVIRHKLRAWIRKFTRIAAAFEEVVYGASALYIGAPSTDADAGSYGVSGHGSVWPNEDARTRELAANVSRIEGWRNTRSYYSFIQDLARTWERVSVVRSLDFGFQLERLKALRMSHDLSAAIYLAIAKAVEEGGASEADVMPSPTAGGPAINRIGSQANGDAAERDGDFGYGLPASLDRNVERRRYTVILQLLTALPDSQSGLFYVSLGLFHPRADVRCAVVQLLESIKEHEAGRHFWASLGRFPKLGFFRVKREMEATKSDEK